MTEKTAQVTEQQASTAHLAPLVQKELASVIAAILLTTRLCTSVLTIASEFLGSGLRGRARTSSQPYGCLPSWSSLL